MSLLGLPAQVLDRMLGTTAARIVPTLPIDTNGHADFDDEKPLRVVNYALRTVLNETAADRDAARAKARLLGRQYGRASHTIGEQRGTIASLRAQLAAALSNDETPGPATAGGGAGRSRPVGSGADQPGPPAGGALGSGPPAGTDEPFDEFTERVCGDLADLGLLGPPSQRAVIARVLTDHELLADDTCRCGWGHLRLDPVVASCPPDCPDGPLWHAEHVAEQLAATGACAPGATTALDRLTAALHQRLAEDKRFMRIGEIFELIRGAR